MTLWEATDTLTVLRCWCGIQHAVPRSLANEQKRKHDEREKDLVIYCPLGHGGVVSGEGRAERLEKQLAAERARHDQTRAERDQHERSLRAERGAKTKLKKRLAGGVCPCCQRTFENLGRHMKTKHPEYAKEDA